MSIQTQAPPLGRRYGTRGTPTGIIVTVLLRATKAADAGENDDGEDDEDALPLETLPAAWADAVAIQSPAAAAIEGAAEATWAVFGFF